MNWVTNDNPMENPAKGVATRIYYLVSFDTNGYYRKSSTENNMETTQETPTHKALTQQAAEIMDWNDPSYTKLARSIGTSRFNLANWRRRNSVPRRWWQHFERVTGGKITFEDFLKAARG